MVQTPASTPAPSPGWTLDKRQAVGLGLGLFCLGILIGFKLASGEPLVIEKPVFVEKPCADCEEKKIREARAAVEPEQSMPGDSSVPE